MTKLSRYKKGFYLSFIGLLMSGCLGFPTEWDIELWEQKIEGTDLSIYKFDAWGGRDTHIAGIKIKNSSKGFTQNDVLKGDEFSIFKTIASKDLIEVIKTVRPKDGEDNSNTPLSKTSFLIENINVNQETYLYNGAVTGKCILQAFNFKTFEETRDSLIFYDNVSQFDDGPGYKRISVPKGNVYLMTSKDNKYVSRVVYEDLLIFEDLTKSNGIKICNHTKYFDSIDSIRVSEFSDYGIFKPVK